METNNILIEDFKVEEVIYQKDNIRIDGFKANGERLEVILTKCPQNPLKCLYKKIKGNLDDILGKVVSIVENIKDDNLYDETSNKKQYVDKYKINFKYVIGSVEFVFFCPRSARKSEKAILKKGKKW